MRGSTYNFDIETDGLYDQVTTIWTLTIYDYDSDTYTRYDKERVIEGLKRLHDQHVEGHNIIGYDIPVIQKLHPWFKVRKVVIDTLVMGRLVFPDIKAMDHSINKARTPSECVPPKLIGSHSLKAYGYRLGMLKGTYGEQDDAWKSWSQEMSDYCEQDVRVGVALARRIRKEMLTDEALDMEHRVQGIISRQEHHGVQFDYTSAYKLLAELLQRKEDLRVELAKVFRPWIAPKGKDRGLFTPKTNNKSRGYIAGAPFCRVQLMEFNPGSRKHIEGRLKFLYNWIPTDFTETGEPKIDDDTIKALPFPECTLLAEYLTVVKRIGQLSDGKEAWLKAVGKDGRIHGRVNTLGTATRRMSHWGPNMAQVPKADKNTPYGKECRALFTPPPGYLQVGCDAAALELRVLSHFIAAYDGGAYGKAAIEGTKEEGTDIHTLTMMAVDAETRDIAKTWFYAWLYGAGNVKLGLILLNGKAGNAGAIGKKSRETFQSRVPALGQLMEALQQTLIARGRWVEKEVKFKDGTSKRRRVLTGAYVFGIDGSKIRIKSEHSALNYLCQSAGALIMKRALIILEDDLQAKGFKHHWQQPVGYDYEFMLNVHDEFQIAVKPELVEVVGQMAVAAIRKAGDHFGWEIPLDGEYKVGHNWAETH